MRWCRATISSAFVGSSASSAGGRGTIDMRPYRRLGTVLLFIVACSPRAKPLVGTLSPQRVPSSELPPVHRKIVFHYDYSQPELHIRGDGVARISAPDSARLDFFVNDQSTGHALLVGDEIRLEDGQETIRKFLPPAPLLWAALGRLHVPAAADTTVRVDSDTVRVDIGHQPGWRATFAGEQLRRLEQIDGGRIPQWVARPAEGPIRYEQPRLRRTLLLTVTRVDTVPGFDASIWR